VTNARSYISEVRFPKHILTRKWDGRSRVYNLHKDLGMAVDLDHKLKTENTSGKDALAFLKKAMGLGIQDPDFTLLYRDFEKIVKIRKKTVLPLTYAAGSLSGRPSSGSVGLSVSMMGRQGVRLSFKASTSKRLY
jgi:hypothetical protein